MESLRLLSHQSFFSAVQSGDLDSLKRILDGEDGDEDQGAALVSALMSLQNDAGETALYIAADNNLEEVFKYLVTFCDLKLAMIRYKLDMNGFHVAEKKGHLGILKKILNLLPVLCQLCESLNTSPLYVATIKDHLAVVNAILDVDVSSVRIVRKNGKTLLHTAARYGLLLMVKALIDKDPGIVSIKDKKGQTALHMAVKGYDPNVVEELLLVDSSILNARDKKRKLCFAYGHEEDSSTGVEARGFIFGPPIALAIGAKLFR